MARETTRRGQTPRAELAVKAYRQLTGGTEVSGSALVRRRVQLQAKLDALLRQLDASETRFYDDAIGADRDGTTGW